LGDWIFYFVVILPLQRLQRMVRAGIRRSRLGSWPTVECTVTAAETTVLDTFLPHQWRVGVSYYFTFQGEYYAGSDHAILASQSAAEDLLARYPKNSHAMIAVNPARPEKEQFIADLLK
jgi:hypothetical protein